LEAAEDNLTMAAQNVSKVIKVAEHSHNAYLEAFWAWVQLMADGDFDAAISALHWDDDDIITPEQLKRLIGLVYGGTEWAVVIPNERLVAEITSSAETNFEVRGDNDDGWFLAHIPVTGEPERAKEDDVELIGVAVSFSVVHRKGHLRMCYEIIHI
jgi:hypothetical protein